ncbi:MAG: LysM peptidoglycan-binding domain-containing protein, partial [Anaerolineales bacterium]|nr:LysM peptidoglycan-binding domain-containing protein [Anaerolineales bacterium]
YTVQAGDTLSALAQRFGTTVEAIVAANNITNPNLINVGQVLEIPGDGATEPPPTGDPSPPSTPGTYTVQSGDTLFRIATRFGTTVEAIVAANNIANANLINVGQVLIIPGGSGVTPSPSPSPAPSPSPITPPVVSGSFELGGQTQSFSNPGLMTNIGMTWVKFQHKWGPG